MRADASKIVSPFARSESVEQELRQHNHELALINSVLLKINQSQDLTSLLDATLDILLEFLGLDSGSIFLSDDSGRHLTLASRRGVEVLASHYLETISTDEAVASSLLSRVQVIENQRTYHPSVSSLGQGLMEEGIASMVSVPLKLEGSMLGVLVLGSRVFRQFTAREIHLLTTAAGQLSIGVENLRRSAEQRETIERLQALNHAISLRHSIYDRLIGLVLEGVGINRIVEMLSELVGNPVSVENQYFRPIAGSSGPPTRKARRGSTSSALGSSPDSALVDPRIKEHIDTLMQRRRPVMLPAFPEWGIDTPRAMAPIIVGSDLLGCVAILEQGRPLHQEDLMAAQQAAVILALEMMKDKVASEVEHRLRGELLQDLLTGSYHSEAAMLSRAAYLGHDLSRPHGLLVVDIDQFSYTIDSLGRAEDRVVALKRKLFEVVRGIVLHSFPSSLVVGRSDSIVILLEHASKASDTEMNEEAQKEQALAETIRGEVQRCLPELSISIAIGPTCRALGDYQRSYERAHRALAACQSLQRRNQIIDSEQLGVYQLLFDHAKPRDLLRFAEDLLGPLLAYDREHHTDLVKTLDKYLRTDCRLEATAAELSIHRSTLLYRLQRISEIGKLNLHDPDVRFNAQLALRIWSVTRSG